MFTAMGPRFSGIVLTMSFPAGGMSRDFDHSVPVIFFCNP